jgi:hypothetical protein
MSMAHVPSTVTEFASDGPSKTAELLKHSYSVPDLSTPRSGTTCSKLFRIVLPETCSPSTDTRPPPEELLLEDELPPEELLLEDELPPEELLLEDELPPEELLLEEEWPPEEPLEEELPFEDPLPEELLVEEPPLDELLPEEPLVEEEPILEELLAVTSMGFEAPPHAARTASIMQ